MKKNKNVFIILGLSLFVVLVVFLSGNVEKKNALKQEKTDTEIIAKDLLASNDDDDNGNADGDNYTYKISRETSWSGAGKNGFSFFNGSYGVTSFIAQKIDEKGNVVSTNKAFCIDGGGADPGAVTGDVATSYSANTLLNGENYGHTAALMTWLASKNVDSMSEKDRTGYGLALRALSFASLSKNGKTIDNGLGAQSCSSLAGVNDGGASKSTCEYFQAIGNCMIGNNDAASINSCLSSAGKATIPDDYMQYIIDVKNYYINNSQPAVDTSVLPSDVTMTYKTSPGKKKEQKPECDASGVCTVTKKSTITFKDGSKELDYIDKATIDCKAQLNIPGLKAECTIEGNVVTAKLTFNKKDMTAVVAGVNGSDKDFKVSIVLDNITTAKILGTSESVIYQRMLIIDTSKKSGTFYIDFKLKDPGCEDIVETNKDLISADKDPEAIKALFQPNYDLDPKNPDKDCCVSIEGIAPNTWNQYCQPTYGTCEEFFEKYVGKGTEGEDINNCKATGKTSKRVGIKANVVTAFWEVHKANNDCPIGTNTGKNYTYIAGKEDYFKTNLLQAMEKSKLTFGEKDGFEDCCDLLEKELVRPDGTFENDQFAEVYETMCGNPECAMIVRKARSVENDNPSEFANLKNALAETFGSLQNDMEKIKKGFDKAKDWLETKYKTTSIGKEDKNSYTLGKSKNKDAIDCCETFSKAGYWNLGQLCKSSCSLALQDKDIKEKVNKISISTASTFDDAKSALEAYKSEESDAKYTLGKKDGFEDCCEIAWNTTKGNNKDDIKAYCQGSCKLVLKDENVLSAIKGVKEDDEDSFNAAKSAVESKSSGNFTLGGGGDNDCCEDAINKNSKLKEYCKEEKTCKNAIASIKKEVKNGTKLDSGLILRYILSPLYLSKDNKSDKNNCCNQLATVSGAKDTDYFKKMCEGDTPKQKDKKLDCELVGFHLQCDPAVFGTTEMYKVHEALDHGDEGKDKISECVITVDGDPGRKQYSVYSGSSLNEEEMSLAEQLHDAALSKNPYTLSDGLNISNQYCRINCYERWDYQFATFENFTGVDHAIKAGSYFALNKDLYIKGARTCVTTYIDYQAYYTAVRQLSNKMTAAWNVLMEYVDAYNDAVAHKNYYDNEEQYSTYTKMGYGNPIFTRDEFETNICKSSHPEGDSWCDDEHCYQEYVCDNPNKDVCPLYSVHVNNSVMYRTMNNYGNLHELLNDYPGDSKYGKNIKETSTYNYNRLGQEFFSTSRTAAMTGTICIDCGTKIRTKWECEYIDKAGGTPESAWAYMLDNYFEYTSVHQKYTQSKKFETPSGWEDGPRYDITGGKVVEVIQKALSDLNSFNQDLRTKTQDMAYCQNFYLSNDEEKVRKVVDDTVPNYNAAKTEEAAAAEVLIYKDNENYIFNGTKKLSKYNPLTPDNTKISTTYNPVGNYKYDEFDYMTQIGEYNQLIDNIKRNNEVYGSPTATFNTKKKATDNDTDQMIYFNKIDTLAYDLKDGEAWGDNSSYGHDYGKSSGALINGLCDESEAGSCVGIKKSSSARKEIQNFMKVCVAAGFKEPDYYSAEPAEVDIDDTKMDCDDNVTFRYYEVNYISQTLTNSSYFVNYGNFYFRGSYEDVQFGRDMADAISKSKVNKSSNEESQWSVLASQNVFPISSTTRRGIYSYVYDFSNMGNYNTNKKDDLGRIIGHGAEGRSVVYGPQNPSSGIGEVGNGERWCQYEVYESLCACCGYPIGTLISVYHSSDDVTIKQHETFKTPPASEQLSKGNNTSGGELLYYPSTVSLYDLSAIGNWGDSTNILYEGQNYETTGDKGGQLANAIKSVGENIYDTQPEYSFRLTPEILQNIIEDNNKHGDSYIINYDNLIVEGEPRYISGKEDPEESPRFVHYSSKFIKDNVAGENKGFLAGRSYDNSCYVESYDEDDLRGFASGSHGNCKWLDFCGSANAYNSDTTPQSIKYCLAFK